MLLKYTQAQKRIKTAGIGKPQRTAGGMVKLTSGLMTLVPKIHRRVIKVANKRPATLQKATSGIKREQIPVDPCDNSNDSGLGFDHHLDYHTSLASHSALHFSDKESAWQSDEPPEVKRRRLEIKLESDDANDNFTFPESIRQQPSRAICMPVRGRSRVVVPLTLSTQLSNTSHNGITQLLIMCQPEQQHRARYQTEGSRGAVKDRTGNGFPVVKLVGYDRPAMLQVFIGTDQGRVAPHMFYQACRVSGKNSTPCVEKKIDGTIVIEVDIEPSKDMVVTCDCVGILKERNVDVEHRFPEERSGRSKKKSTRCRMVFRTTITHPDGSQETLQVTSQPIVCTQPPGVPEICKKSLSSCSVQGGQELFILGKNFLKDTRVVFLEGDNSNPSWTQSVQPDKEFLQQSHLVCVVPAYKTSELSEPVTVKLMVESSGKASEPHSFLYMPSDHPVVTQDGNFVNNSVISQGGNSGVFASSLPGPPPLLMSSETSTPFMTAPPSAGSEEKLHPVMMWEKPGMMMLPPQTTSMPISMRRPSVQMIVPEQLDPEDLKQEVLEQPPVVSVSGLTSSQSPSMDTIRRFVSNTALPPINVGNYLTNIEGEIMYNNKLIKPQIINEVPRIIIPSPTSLTKPVFSGDSSNLLTTVETIISNRGSAMPFDGRNPPSSQLAQENLNVNMNASVIQKSPLAQMSPDVQHKQMSDTRSVGGLDLMMSSVMKSEASTSTEKLDAFVNSAAESHISPNPTPMQLTSVIGDNSGLNPINEIVVSGTNNRDLQESKVSPMMQAASIPVSPHTSPHQGTSTNDGALCSLLNSSVQDSSQNCLNQSHSSVSTLHVALDHITNQNSIQTNSGIINNMIPTSPQITSNHSQVYSNLQISLDPQLSSQALASAHMNHSDINNLMQTSPQACKQQIQSISNLQATFDQISPQVNSVQPSCANVNLMHMSPQSRRSSSPQDSTDQGHVMSNVQTTLEQHLCSQALSSTPPRTTLNNIINTTAINPSNETQVLSNLQATLQHHMSSQTVNTTQVICSETVQPSNLTLNSIGNVMQSNAQASTNEVHALTSLQASLECHLSRGIDSVSSEHDSLASRNVAMNSRVVTSPQIEMVNQAQTIPNLQASYEHHLSSQVLGSAQPILDSRNSNTHSPHSLSSMESSSQGVVSQNEYNQSSNLQMSLEQLNSQVLVSSQSEHVSNGPVSSPQGQVVVSNAQVLSDLQATFEHLNSQVPKSSPGTMMSVESLNGSAQSSSQQSSSQALCNLQASIDHLSSQVLTSAQSNHIEQYPPNKGPISDSQSIDLSRPIEIINSQPIDISSNSTSSNSPVLLSPTSRHSPSSLITSTGIPINNTPTNLSMHSAQPVEVNSPNIVLSTSQSLLATEMSVSDVAPLSLTRADHKVFGSQSNLNQFQQVTQGISVQVDAINQYEQQKIQKPNESSERNEGTPFIIQSSQSEINRQQCGFALRPGQAQPVRKCEEGMPLPHELTQMSEHDLIRYINPSCFDTGLSIW